MAKLVVSEFVTVDGYMEDPGGAEKSARGGWAFQFNRGDEGDRFKLDEVLAAEALLLGRHTYEGFAAAWPARPEGDFANKMNDMPKYVVSASLDKADWNNSTILRGDPATEAADLKQNISGDLLVYGSATLVGALAANDLVDEYRLMIFPTLLGQGRRLFTDSPAALGLRLTSARPVGDDGVVVLTYEPRH
ncbi:dihydrofolate reductase family protein [Nonomuraea sp. NPDC050536]|uniref:dihydrofolate reductase family protein n=1 Tax=Nonomuraea sp. NPDC050536 TaxID=3364366 RepID=UPI0037C7B4CD